MKIYAFAPSNIAWIKYMGKQDKGENLPENPSISLTLRDLATHLTLTPSQGAERRLLPLTCLPEAFATNLKQDDFFAPEFSQSANDKFFRHVDRVRSEIKPWLEKWDFGFQDRLSGGFDIHSANTFPAASGIASSASSFAALTLAVAALCARDPNHFIKALQESGFSQDVEKSGENQGEKGVEMIRSVLAGISRKGSGSSCRSFSGPLVEWEQDQVKTHSAENLGELTHFVLLISNSEKKVSSSEAHRRVKTSPLWEGRKCRAIERLGAVKSHLQEAHWSGLSRVIWQEFWEMHSLFHTSQPPFSYWLPRTTEALRLVEGLTLSGGLSPIMTMDAGPNLHFTVPTILAREMREFLNSNFPDLKVLEDELRSGESSGARAEVIA